MQVFGVTLLCATLALPGQQYQWVDSNNRLIETPGWPVRCTIVRYALCTLVILTIAFNLIPLNSRVVSYTVCARQRLHSTTRPSDGGRRG